MPTAKVEFVVTPERLEAANRVIKDRSKHLTEDQLFAISDELRFGLEQSSLTMDLRKMRFAMTDLQTVAFAAALVAAVEAGGGTKEASTDAVVRGEIIPF